LWPPFPPAAGARHIDGDPVAAAQDVAVHR
jgi:hypothetical protein